MSAGAGAGSAGMILEGAGMIMDIIGQRKAAKAKKKQAKLNASIERRNRANQRLIEARNKELLDVDILRLQEEADFAEQDLRIQLSGNLTTQLRNQSRQVGSARARGMSEDVVNDIILEGERKRTLEKIAVENQVRKLDFQAANRIYDTKIEIQNIGIRSKFADEASDMRVEQIMAGASDSAYMWAAAGSAIQGGASLLKSGRDLGIF